MRTKCIDSEPHTKAATGDATEPDVDQRAVEAVIMMMLLSSTHEGPWTRAELERELSAPALDVQDALAALQGSGLLHMQGELVTASRAAQRMDQLEL
jgi:hypothetical protein